ncbi:isocitrate lyase/PEP mutase family protein [Paraburkholderia sp.]|uniref:isocitrate lyase/PEP mutase family protein n=1 Tax=Paraburkholderia sp. TaxID=1926495 RepID=UPI0039E71B61
MPQTFRALLNSGKVILAPGVFDGLSAQLVEGAGYSAMYASGGAISRAAGYPDLNVLSLTEVVERLEKIVSATALPVIADADTGFGGAANIDRTVRLFARAGVAALHIEDQVFPKRCGRLSGKSIIPIDEMCHRLRVARHAIGSGDVVLIARTDANSEEGFEAALTRVKAYESMDVDMVFVEGVASAAEIERLGTEIKVPKLINMYYGGKTPLMPTEALQQAGVRVVIVPSDLQRAAAKAMQRTLHALKEDGHSRAVAHDLISVAERDSISRTSEYIALDNL